MHATRGDICVRTDNNAQLSRLVLRELESIILSKDTYDRDFPDHAKCLSRSELWKISFNKVLERLCLPSSEAED